MGMPHITPEIVAYGMIWYVVFLFSTTCHEAAHALAAKLGGDLTAFHGGQVTLNPVPHIQRSPMGMVVIPIASYFMLGWMMGMASAPYDPVWQSRYPKRAAWMAMAGPAANFALMLIAAVGIRGGVALGVFQNPARASFAHITEAVSPESMGFWATFLSILFMLNLVLGTFNLLPVPPLDGNSGIALLMPERMAQRWLAGTRDSSFGAMGIVLGSLLFSKIFDPIFTLALNLLYPWAQYGP